VHRGHSPALLPPHRNPTVRETPRGPAGHHPRASLTEPLNYEPAGGGDPRPPPCLLTDSGGLQRAPALGKPVLVLCAAPPRGLKQVSAERPKLIGTDSERIVRRRSPSAGYAPAAYAAMAQARNPFGDGQPAAAILAGQP